MQRKNYGLALMLALASCAYLTCGVTTQAQDKKVDPTGTWVWSMQGRDGAEARKITLKLKAEGEKLTGTVTTPGRQGGEARETAIEEAKLKGDELTFAVTREFGGNKMTQKYVGKITGDVIKGKIEFQRGGEAQSREWEAKREPKK
jgi:hypothetical protein